MNISKILMQINNIDLGEMNTYGDLPCNTYVKYFNGKYLSCNDHQAKMFGLDHKTDVVGLDDFELFAKNIASYITENDAEVKHSGKTMIFNEPFTSPEGLSYVATSIKSPLRIKEKEVIGVVGVSIIQSAATQDNNIYGLTQRQIDCLYYLVKGKSIKETGKALTLSHRTVEHYLENVKFKLKCATKVDLIAKALAMKCIRDRL